MKNFKSVQLISGGLMLAAGLAAASVQSTPPAPPTCGQSIANDAKAISADLSAIAAQADAQGFNSAVEQFAAGVESVLPALNRPSQDAVQKFVTDLANATSSSGPGGATITPSERLVLTNDWVILVTSTGATSSQISTISDDLVAVLSSMKGISLSQLQADFGILISDAQSCAVQN